MFSQLQVHKEILASCDMKKRKKEKLVCIISGGGVLFNPTQVLEKVHPDSLIQSETRFCDLKFVLHCIP